MSPLCKWAFQISYGLDVDEISVDRLAHELQTRPVLLYDGDNPGCLEPRKVSQIVDFLRQNLAPPPDAASVSTQEP